VTASWLLFALNAIFFSKQKTPFRSMGWAVHRSVIASVKNQSNTSAQVMPVNNGSSACATYKV